ncbi:MAG: hypothetical protein WCK37_04810 [Candidatus Falkowbacteria bacterium]
METITDAMSDVLDSAIDLGLRLLMFTPTWIIWMCAYLIVIAFVLRRLITRAPTLIFINRGESVREKIIRGDYYWEPELKDEKIALLLGYFGCSIPPQKCFGTYLCPIILHFNSFQSAEEIDKYLDRHNYRPGTFLELLEYGEGCHDKRLNYSLVAPGAVISNNCCGWVYPRLMIDSHGRRILDVVDAQPKTMNEFYGPGYFLVFKK